MTKEELIESKKELKDYIYDKKWLEERWEDIEERRSLLDKITNTLSDLPKGTPQVNDKVAERLTELLDVTKEYEQYLETLNKRQIKIERKIDKLEQPFRNILYFRYIKGYNLTEVSGKIEEEYDYTRKLHGIALIKYSEVVL